MENKEYRVRRCMIEAKKTIKAHFFLKIGLVCFAILAIYNLGKVVGEFFAHL